MKIDLGRLAFYSADDQYRPSLWITLRRSQVVIFFGWQWPSVLWLR